MVEGGPCHLIDFGVLSVNSLVNFHLPFDLYNVSWVLRLVKQERLGKGKKRWETPQQSSLTDCNFYVRGKVHGNQGIRGLRFMKKKLVEELREISKVKNR